MKFFNDFKKKILRKKFILISLAFIFLLFLFYFLWMSIYGPWWKIWPQNIRTTIAINRLAISIYNNPYCHTDCYFQQSIYQQEIVKSLNKPKVLERMNKIIFNENENLNWRIGAIKIVSLSENVDTKIFQEYLDGDLSDLEIKRTIFLNFKDRLDVENYSSYLKNLISDEYSLSREKILALKSLSDLHLSLGQFYLSILLIEKDDDVIVEILRALGSDNSRFNVDKNTLFNYLENIIRSNQSSFSSRRLALFILSDFLNNDVDGDIYKLFEKLVLSGEIDKFNRYLIIETFNNYLEEEYDLPEISEEDWAWYYQQK